MIRPLLAIASGIGLILAGLALGADINNLPVKKSGKIGGEVTLTYEFEAPAPEPAVRACTAQVEISYSQMNDKVAVDTTLINEDCAASQGEYSVQLRTRDESGNSSVLSFDETWSRESTADIESTKNYEIGENVELVWARINRVSCACSPPEEPAE